MKYRTILADPPWPHPKFGSLLQERSGLRAAADIYPLMSIDDLCAMPVAEQSEQGAHLWLWVTDQFLHEGFHVMSAWGFKYHAPIVWAKPSGCGNYFLHQTEFLLFGYKGKCIFNKARYVPNIYYWKRGEHSEKPAASYELIESISDEPRLELFARPITPMFPKIEGWHVFGNEVESDVQL